MKRLLRKSSVGRDRGESPLVAVLGDRYIRVAMLMSFLRNLPIPFLGADRPVVTVVRLNGVIASGGRFGSGINLAGIADALDRAFSPNKLKAVALVINSPGGSPAQSNLITKRVRDLAREKHVPVLAFVEDVAASGGYMLACAADEIIADESSIVGSIGVISAGLWLSRA